MDPKLAALMGLLRGAKQLPKIQPKAKPNLPKKPIAQRPSSVGGY